MEVAPKQQERLAKVRGYASLSRDTKPGYPLQQPECKLVRCGISPRACLVLCMLGKCCDIFCYHGKVSSMCCYLELGLCNGCTCTRVFAYKSNRSWCSVTTCTKNLSCENHWTLLNIWEPLLHERDRSGQATCRQWCMACWTWVHIQKSFSGKFPSPPCPQDVLKIVHNRRM